MTEVRARVQQFLDIYLIGSHIFSFFFGVGTLLALHG
jgi:hypothetical protein